MSQDGLQQPVGHTQEVVNKLVDVVRDSDVNHQKFSGMAIHAQPNANVDTMTTPFLWIYAEDSEYNDHGFQNKYKYALTIFAVVVVKHQVPKDRNRKIHRYEQQIHDMLIKNRQPAISGLRVSQWRILRAKYIDQPSGIKNIDSLTLELLVNYDRQVEN